MSKLAKIAGLIILLVLAVGATSAFAQVDTEYKPLTTLPGVFEAGKATNPVSVLKGIYGLAIGVGSVITVVMIIYAGFKYMYEESITGKTDAKEYIWNAILGLLVILGSYIFLETINPALVEFDVSLQGGKGRIQSLGIAVKQLDDANKNAAAALKERDMLAGQIKTLTQKETELKAIINATSTTSEAKLRAESELKTAQNQIQTKSLSKAILETQADTLTVLARIDENIIRRSTGEKNIEVNINESQTSANNFFDRTILELNKFDQNNPEVKKTIDQIRVRKDALNAEFAQQRVLNSVLNVTDADATQKNIATAQRATINRDIAIYSQKLKENGLSSEASAFEARSKNRLEVLCAKNLCTN